MSSPNLIFAHNLQPVVGEVADVILPVFGNHHPGGDEGSAILFIMGNDRQQLLQVDVFGDLDLFYRAHPGTTVGGRGLRIASRYRGVKPKSSVPRTRAIRERLLSKPTNTGIEYPLTFSKSTALSASSFLQIAGSSNRGFTSSANVQHFSPLFHGLQLASQIIDHLLQKIPGSR